MIASLTGRLAFKAPTHLTLDVQGVGYDVLIPLSTYYGLPDLNATLALNIHTHVREDAILLFGFSSRQEKETFLLLTTVSGVGPKTALGILSALPVSDLVSAIHAGDVEKLETIPGIGKKSAGRLVLELKDKLGKLHPGPAAPAVGLGSQHDRDAEDALSALTNLGYRLQDAKEALKRVRQERPAPLSLQELIRHSLKELARG
ncbi:Holliday junction ATP-dependent DNA helicase RuvA [Nitrospira japonica]|uniref:Holliday junction branch migration complex subunit RuvA n=1 Tax=Nitrospira japonica TaxID=1325564 RepID=A0A1W1I3W7_9BACT|nr:Holliday junction branch migration protein RuvA [Nitrospira japonica]SLM47641.1 Holliday junction ATP-dependent DNA helicase RuvA [Nitrospira japonica]